MQTEIDEMSGEIVRLTSIREITNSSFNGVIMERLGQTNKTSTSEAMC